MKNQIKIEKLDTGHIETRTPYHPEFPARARELGGVWNPSKKTWTFDARDEQDVRELLIAVYGADGDDVGDLVDVRVTVGGVEWDEDCGAIFFAGRQIARAFGRDSGAKLGPGVVLKSGKARSSGSRKNWTTEIAAGSVLEIRDLPCSAVEDELGVDPNLTIEILTQVEVDREALEAEKARLAARLAEIDKLLG